MIASRCIHGVALGRSSHLMVTPALFCIAFSSSIVMTFKPSFIGDTTNIFSFFVPSKFSACLDNYACPFHYAELLTSLAASQGSLETTSLVDLPETTFEVGCYTVLVNWTVDLGEAVCGMAMAVGC